MHVGQFQFAKWSIGDNETLIKIAETLFDLAAKRTSESIASHVVYPLSAPPEIDWISQVVGEVAELGGSK